MNTKINSPFLWIINLETKTEKNEHYKSGTATTTRIFNITLPAIEAKKKDINVNTMTDWHCWRRSPLYKTEKSDVKQDFSSLFLPSPPVAESDDCFQFPFTTVVLLWSVVSVLQREQTTESLFSLWNISALFFFVSGMSFTCSLCFNCPSFPSFLHCFLDLKHWQYVVRGDVSDDDVDDVTKLFLTSICILPLLNLRAHSLHPNSTTPLCPVVYFVATLALSPPSALTNSSLLPFAGIFVTETQIWVFQLLMSWTPFALCKNPTSLHETDSCTSDSKSEQCADFLMYAEPTLWLDVSCFTLANDKAVKDQFCTFTPREHRLFCGNVPF